MKINWKLLVIWIIIFSLNTFQRSPNRANHYMNNEATKEIIPSLLLNQFTPHDPIVIDDNSDFQALGFLGSGTELNPYIISGYNITHSISNLITISHTTVFFSIENNHLDGQESEFSGIVLRNVSHGIISNNSIDQCKYGIYIVDSTDNSIVDNYISNHSYSGINFDGIPCFNNRVSRNLISNNTIYGIMLSYGCSLIFISDNTIQSNEFGIFSFTWSANNTITRNEIENSRIGIYIGDVSTNYTVTRNEIANNLEYGLEIRSCDKIRVDTNNFIENNLGNTQSFDDSSLNEWSNGKHGNFWSDYTGSDTNGDGVGEIPYTLDGGSSGLDPHPLIVEFSEEKDSDSDGMHNLWEYQMGLNPTFDDGSLDKDTDGMSNLWEYQMGLNATLDDAGLDKDFDGMSNLWEFQMGLNATLDDASLDKDSDGYTNLEEYNLGSNPNDPYDPGSLDTSIHTSSTSTSSESTSSETITFIYITPSFEIVLLIGSIITLNCVQRRKYNE